MFSFVADYAVYQTCYRSPLLAAVERRCRYYDHYGSCRWRISTFHTVHQGEGDIRSRIQQQPFIISYHCYSAAFYCKRTMFWELTVIWRTTRRTGLESSTMFSLQATWKDRKLFTTNNWCLLCSSPTCPYAAADLWCALRGATRRQCLQTTAHLPHLEHSMRQIINSVCLCYIACLSIYLSCDRISWSIFPKIGSEVTIPKSKNKFVQGQHRIAPPFRLIFHPQTAVVGQNALKIDANISLNMLTMFARELPEFPPCIGNRGRGTRYVTLYVTVMTCIIWKV